MPPMFDWPDILLMKNLSIGDLKNSQKKKLELLMKAANYRVSTAELTSIGNTRVRPAKADIPRHHPDPRMQRG